MTFYEPLVTGSVKVKVQQRWWGLTAITLVLSGFALAQPKNITELVQHNIEETVVAHDYCAVAQRRFEQPSRLFTKGKLAAAGELKENGAPAFDGTRDFIDRVTNDLKNYPDVIPRFEFSLVDLRESRDWWGRNFLVLIYDFAYQQSQGKLLFLTIELGGQFSPTYVCLIL